MYIIIIIQICVYKLMHVERFDIAFYFLNKRL